MVSKNIFVEIFADTLAVELVNHYKETFLGNVKNIGNMAAEDYKEG